MGLRSLIALVLALTVGAGGVGTGYLVDRLHPVFAPLPAAGVALGTRGAVVAVEDSAALVPGTRVLAGTPDTDRLVAEQRAWLRAGSVPSVPELGDSDLVRDALLDLYVLSRPGGVPVAGWSGPWRYVWPRDAALAAAAFARTGHVVDAERIVDFLGRVQPASGLLQARYRVDGNVPDGRGVQLDGVGWALWAMAQTAYALPREERPAFVARHRALLDTSVRAIGAATAGPAGLPAASPDYWETSESAPTLATAAVLRAGLQAAARLYAVAGDGDRASSALVAAGRLGTAITAAFGPDGYPRRLGGRGDSLDLGVDFLLPPFADAADAADPAVLGAWRRAPAVMARASGGLAPGGSWRRDGVSWTNVTATYALTAACLGDRNEALARLRWLDASRTAVGALPEKVLPGGRAASVAPLAWTAAAVVLTADELAG